MHTTSTGFQILECLILFISVVACGHVGKYARKKGHSQVFYTVLSLFITPILGFLVVEFLQWKRPEPEEKTESTSSE